MKQSIYVDFDYKGKKYRVSLVNIKTKVIDDEPFWLYDIAAPASMLHLLQRGEFRFNLDQAAQHILNEEVAG